MNSFEVHGLVCPGLQPFILGADTFLATVHRHGRAVALKGDGESTIGLRFEFHRFRGGGARWTHAHSSQPSHP